MDKEQLEFLQDNSLEDRVQYGEVWSFLREKDDATRDIFVWYFVAGLTLKEIALRMKKKESFVKNRLYRTLKELREWYTEGGGDVE